MQVINVDSEFKQFLLGFKGDNRIILSLCSYLKFDATHLEAIKSIWGGDNVCMGHWVKKADGYVECNDTCKDIQWQEIFDNFNDLNVTQEQYTKHFGFWCEMIPDSLDKITDYMNDLLHHNKKYATHRKDLFLDLLKVRDRLIEFKNSHQAAKPAAPKVSIPVPADVPSIIDPAILPNSSVPPEQKPQVEDASLIGSLIGMVDDSGKSGKKDIDKFARDQPEQHGVASFVYLRSLQANDELKPIIDLYIDLSTRARRILHAAAKLDILSVDITRERLNAYSPLPIRDALFAHASAQQEYRAQLADTIIARIKSADNDASDCVFHYALYRHDSSIVVRVNSEKSLILPVPHKNQVVANCYLTAMIATLRAIRKGDEPKQEEMNITLLKQYLTILSDNDPATYFVRPSWVEDGNVKLVSNGIKGVDSSLDLSEVSLIMPGTSSQVTVGQLVNNCGKAAWDDAVNRVRQSNSKIDDDGTWANLVYTISESAKVRIPIDKNIKYRGVLDHINIVPKNVDDILSIPTFMSAHSIFFNVDGNVTSGLLRLISSIEMDHWRKSYECFDTGNLVPRNHVSSYRRANYRKTPFIVMEYAIQLECTQQLYNVVPMTYDIETYEDHIVCCSRTDNFCPYKAVTPFFFDFAIPGHRYIRMALKHRPSSTSEWQVINIGQSSPNYQSLKNTLKSGGNVHAIFFLGKQDCDEFFKLASNCFIQFAPGPPGAFLGCYALVYRNAENPLPATDQSMAYYNYYTLVMTGYNVRSRMFSYWPPAPVNWAKFVVEFHSIKTSWYTPTANHGRPFRKREAVEKVRTIELATIGTKVKDELSLMGLGKIVLEAKGKGKEKEDDQCGVEPQTSSSSTPVAKKSNGKKGKKKSGDVSSPAPPPKQPPTAPLNPNK